MSIPITYIRSSSYSSHEMCEMKYFGEYVLGWTGPPNKKADKGTIVHKVMEILANVKLARQNGLNNFEDDIIGEVFNLELDSETGKRFRDDVPLMLAIFDKIYGHYTNQSSNHIWAPADYRETYKWLMKAISYNNGSMHPFNQEIVEPERHFDIEMKQNWAKYEYDLNGEKISGNLRLKGTIDLITKIDKTTHEIIDYKGLPLYTKIPTINGWTTMGNIKVGDTIYDKNGNETKVIGKSQIKYKDCYEITFDDNSSVVCDDEHIWLLSDGSEIKTVDLSEKDKIDVTKPIFCKYKDLPIDPYVLGVWLGDGRNRTGEISGQDSFIFNEIKKRGYKVGKNISQKSCPSHTIFGLVNQLKKLNLLHNKHIPDIYLRSSVKQRLDLLRGLMDSDGYANATRKQAVFMNCNKILSEDVKKLLITLGQRPYLSKTKANGFGLEVDAYPIFFRPVNINPFLLPRKAKKIKKEWGPGRSSVRKITKITKIKKQFTQCIMVDSPTHTYLCTENMIPTHNTGKRINWATGEEKTYEYLHKDFQLRLYHYAHNIIYPHIDNVLVTIFFINDGGAFTLAFGKNDIPETVNMIKEKFEYIKNTEQPKPNYTWKCKKFCHLGKQTFEDTHIKALEAKPNSKLSIIGEKMCMCDEIKYALDFRPIEDVISNMTKESYSISKYKAPGEIE